MRPDRLDESRRALAIIVENRRQRLFALDFDLAVRPARDLHDGVDDRGIVLVRVERDLRNVVSKSKFELYEQMTTVPTSVDQGK